MTQKNGKESIQDYIKRAQNDALGTISDLNRHVTSALQGAHGNGLTISDFGSKISSEEGKLEILRMIDYLTDDKVA
jgi:hypothetical protein